MGLAPTSSKSSMHAKSGFLSNHSIQRRTSSTQKVVDGGRCNYRNIDNWVGSVGGGSGADNPRIHAA